MDFQSNIFQKLSELETKLEERHQENKRSLSAILSFIDGNGHEGARVRMDRVEQVVKLLTFLVGGTLLAVIGNAVRVWFH